MQCIICLQYLSRCSQPGLSISLSVRAARLLRLTARPGIHGSANVMELPSPCAFSFAIPCQLSCAHALACLFVFLQETSSKKRINWCNCMAWVRAFSPQFVKLLQGCYLCCCLWSWDGALGIPVRAVVEAQCMSAGQRRAVGSRGTR